jgi:toxin ParE1/3/4
MRLVLTPRAERGLEAIGDWIAQDNPVRAATFMDEFEVRLGILTQSPMGFPLAPGYERLGVRRYVWRDYLAFYRIHGPYVIVLHIAHGARDQDNLSFESWTDA